ncbi:VOC family protein [Luteimicrobium subarcticum]|uniref:Putative enzyme related to lactoylglutathione lyase n=1 Tax=Luteimicrobium subarcticum TaxID=620910 RepID=A0A2M8WJJ9_9MICO|nr:VOC family protein [Luteimicrobium subarcticum]PJI91111.1 putative enzyme related to lactoylglutathione lyase [Luteimicrobium subarcticum]
MSTVQPVVLSPDPAVLLDFYTQLVGAVPTFRRPARGRAFYLGLRLGDTDLGLVHRPDLDVGTAPRVVLSIEVDDVDGTVARVEALGGTVSRGGQDMPWGQRVAHVLDPDGNPVNLTQPTPA